MPISHNTMSLVHGSANCDVERAGRGWDGRLARGIRVSGRADEPVKTSHVEVEGTGCQDDGAHAHRVLWVERHHLVS